MANTNLDQQPYSADQLFMLRGIAEYVSRHHHIRTTPDELMQNFERLNTMLNEVKINWYEIAGQLGVNRNKLYHWYYETHLRHISMAKITAEEKAQMQALILMAIESKEIEEVSFQNRLKLKVFGDKEVHRAEFSMTFNNLMRTKVVKVAIQRCNIKLPTRRKGADVEATGDAQSYSYVNSYAGSLSVSGINSPRPELANDVFMQVPNYDQMHDQVTQQLLKLQQNQRVAASNNPFASAPLAQFEQKLFIPFAMSVPIRSRNVSPPPERQELTIRGAEHGASREDFEDFDYLDSFK